MSFAKNFFILSAFVYFYKFLNKNDQDDLKKVIDTKIKKYNTSIEKLISLVDLYESNPKGIRNEKIGIDEKFSNTFKDIENIPTQELEEDLNKIVKSFGQKISVLFDDKKVKK